ncbi:hypothetical protein BKA66DRAFT_542379 [Pyrenochaeta sp. MPI-SDFR-AT-0127]|nr:hypothetical protein BKA66DRAFT_542379 [Pyrenochaeta sp. MPI-SDFR-AT-0127]
MYIDLAYVPPVDREVVISLYQEPLSMVQSLISTLRNDIPSLSGARVHIYIQNRDVDIGFIQQQTGAENVSQLPKIGREGETILYHIISQWDFLAEHTLFIQADVHNPREFHNRLRRYFDPKQTGMLSLGFSGHTCSYRHGCGDQWGWRETSNIISHIYSQVYNVSEPHTKTCRDILLSYKGQFIVSGRRIRGIPKATYIKLHSALVDMNSWAHQSEYINSGSDSSNSSLFGYTLERLWNLIFQCSDMNIAWKCASLLSRERRGGSIQDCQCLDKIS